MATRYASAARRLALRQDGTKDWRAYIDFRQKRYPSVAGTPTFTTVPSDLEVFPLTEKGAASWKGRAPSATPVIVEEPALIGATANPRVKWAGRGAIGVWKATTNLIPSPEDWSTATGGTTAVDATAVNEYVVAIGRTCTKISATANNGYVKKGAITLVASTGYSISFCIYATEAVAGTIYLFDEIDLSIYYDFTLSAGLNYITASGNTDTHTSWLPRIKLNTSGKSVWILTSQAELGLYGTPYTSSSRSAGSLPFSKQCTDGFAIEGWMRPYHDYTSATYHTYFSWVDAANAVEIMIYYDPADDKIKFYFGNIAGTAYRAKSGAARNAATLNTWIHFKATGSFSSAVATFALDGTDQATSATAGTQAAMAALALPIDMWIGDHEYYGSRWADSLITDLAIWDTADTSTAHYTAGTYWQPSDLMAINRSGSHVLSGSSAACLLSMASSFTFEATLKELFAYDTTVTNYVFAWKNGANNYLYLYYNPTDDRYRLEWKDGGTVRYLESAVYSSGSNLGTWKTIAGTVDLTSVATSGSVLYVNGVSVDSEWSGAIDIKVSSFPLLRFRSDGTTEGLYTIGAFRLFQSYKASAAEVASGFSGVKNEEIVWHFNGHATGRTRCNVTSRLLSMSLEKRIESPLGNACANQLGIVLSSPQGQFADDQVAAFDAANEVYNGTVDQLYMNHRCGVELESWVSGAPELEFVGRIDEAGFKRRSGVGMRSRVDLAAYDMVEDIKRKTKRQGGYYEDYDLCAPASAGSSLLHVIARLATAPEWYNFFPNSSFENAAIGSSCTIATGTLTRTAGGLLGSYEGVFAASVAASIYWETTFQGYTKKLNVGENWNWSLYAKATLTCSATITLSEYAGSVLTALGTSTTVLTSSWQKMEVTKAITTSATNLLRLDFSKAMSASASIDCAMLIQNDTGLDYFVLNSDDGAAGQYAADSADSGSYDTVGFDVDEAKYTSGMAANTAATNTLTHPWSRIESGDNIWDHVRQIGDALVAGYIGMDAAGTLKMRTIFQTGYVDPAPLYTVGTEIATLDSVIEPMQANKIVVHGIRIRKYADDVNARLQLIWNIESDPAWKGNGAYDIHSTVAAGATWPIDTALNYEYWARYGAVGEES